MFIAGPLSAFWIVPTYFSDLSIIPFVFVSGFEIMLPIMGIVCCALGYNALTI